MGDADVCVLGPFLFFFFFVALCTQVWQRMKAFLQPRLAEVDRELLSLSQSPLPTTLAASTSSASSSSGTSRATHAEAVQQPVVPSLASHGSPEKIVKRDGILNTMSELQQTTAEEKTRKRKGGRRACVPYLSY